jgi:hypothetical protein
MLIAVLFELPSSRLVGLLAFYRAACGFRALWQLSVSLYRSGK